MIEVRYDRLHTDILRKLYAIKKPHRYLEKKKIISRATLYRIQKEKPINLDIFFKLVYWLDKDINHYIKRR